MVVGYEESVCDIVGWLVDLLRIIRVVVLRLTGSQNCQLQISRTDAHAKSIALLLLFLENMISLFPLQILAFGKLIHIDILV